MINDGVPRGFLPLLLFTIFLSAAMGNMVAVALPFIGEDFGVDEPTYGWIVSAYLLTMGVFNPIYGRLGDQLGIRRMYLAALSIFSVCSLASAAAPSIGALIGIRVLQGVGAAGLSSLGAAMVGRLYPPERRGMAMGAVFGTIGVAASIAPFLGGALMELSSWRMVFLVPALGAVAIPLALRILPAELDRVNSDEPFDAVGAVLLALGIGALMVSLDRMRSVGLQPLELGLLLSSFVLLGVLVAWTRRSPHPFLPPEVLGDARFLAVAGVAAIASTARFGSVVLVPIVLVKGFDVSPIGVGVALFPGALLLAGLAPLSGKLSDRLGPLPVAGPGIVGVVVASLLAAALTGYGSLGMTVAMGCFGMTFAFVQAPLLTSVARILPLERYGIGNGLFLMLFFMGGSVGVLLTVSALALQPEGTPALLPFVPDAVGRYSNAFLLQAGVTTLAFGLLPRFPRFRSPQRHSR